ncbi:MAG: AMP-binding protein [Clostridia bacterium]|nr:AMP-binding protein [Clostridia bacterium]
MNQEINKRVKTRLSALKNTAESLETVYNIMFSDGARVLAETSDGFRIKRHTYGQIKQRVEKLSAALYQTVGATHAWVGLEMENSVDWIAAFWAILRSGNKPYLINCRHSQKLAEDLVRTLGITHIVSDKKGNLPFAYLTVAELEAADAPTFAGEFENELALSTSATTLNEVVCFYTGKQITEQLYNSWDIVQTSPAIATHYHGQLKLLAFLPFYHIFGLAAVYFWFSFFGCTLVFLRDYGAQTILKTCRKHEVTHIFAVPMLWHTIEKQLTKEIASRSEAEQKRFARGKKLATALQNISPRLGGHIARWLLREVTDKVFGRSVRFCISGGSSLRASALELFNAIGYPLHNGYGMSEVGITSVELRSRPKYRNKNAIGRPFGSVEYRITDEGVLQVKGGSICDRLLFNGEERPTPEWFDTGDIVECIDGDYYICGRTGDRVIGESGENINPDMIEQHFDLPDAESFSVLGMPADGKEVLTMVVQINPFLPADRKEALAKTIYAANGTLPLTMQVAQFFVTTQAIAPPTAVKVSRRYLQRAVENGDVTLAPLSALRDTVQSEKADSPLLAEVTALTAKVLGREIEEITPDAHLITDLGASSIQYFGVLTALADRFGLSEPSQAEKETFRYTVREFCEYIERHL